ncbi:MULTISPECIES: corrinoid protein [Desulfosporosinus]|uniref:5-methyltetrahydrofolate--homocysteine methyltransferase n=2 Tax=Desulfosporosinus TaxID=79206 RepID=A0A1G8KWP8_9FIRM|nr:MULTISPECIES: corrinoid protein [Desulfosporosinus]AFQ43596.1 putative cobalamin binding protein [Desulfosporosinus meridiei DSM 13257]SDI47809.1 5-methyltetrahydrofolate--homocysteine methyltransferase [Desulfosporosinus hippei DSM 8344]
MSVQDIYDAVVEFSVDKVVSLVDAEVKSGTDVSEILSNGLIAAMDEVGQRYSEGEFFVPEMLMAAKAMKGGLEVLKPLLSQGDSDKKGTIIIGTVKGDLHDIGKNLVSMMMEGAGFEVYDLGVDVDTDKFIATAKEKNADVICMSALLTTTMPFMEVTVKAIREQGLSIKTMVGGAPVSEDFANKIGADGWSTDAPGAVETARRLTAK